MIRLFLDEDSMDRKLAAAFRRRGVDVLTALEAGMSERDDVDLLEHATSLGRVVYTFNIGDFSRIHAAYQQQGKTHAGLIFARQKQYSVGEQLRRLMKLMATLSEQEMVNRVEYLTSWV
jgi:hypothetical protein